MVGLLEISNLKKFFLKIILIAQHSNTAVNLLTETLNGTDCSCMFYKYRLFLYVLQIWKCHLIDIPSSIFL